MVGVGLVGISPSALAAPRGAESNHSPSAQVRASGVTVGSGYVIVNPKTAKKVGSATFYPTGPIADDTMVVVPNSDGSLPAGLTPAKLTALAAEKSASARQAKLQAAVSPAAAQSYAWSSTSAGMSRVFPGGNIIGTTDSATAVYSFYTAAGYNQQASANGKGHYRGYNGSTFGFWTKYYALGNTGSGGTSKAIPWGNTSDVTGFQAQCTKSNACFGNFMAGY